MMLDAGSQRAGVFFECCYGPDEILGPDTGCADTTAEDGRAGDEDPPTVVPTNEHKRTQNAHIWSSRTILLQER
jgi:hypothetical protein